MQFVARVDRPHPVVSFEEFYQLAPVYSSNRHGFWHHMQNRRWRALLDLLEAFRYRDEPTWRHCRRVQEHALNLGMKLNLTSEELSSLRMAAMVHDIGKMAISGRILYKKDRLSEDELNTIRQHTTLGEKLVEPLLPHKPVLAAIRHHHERIDGLGYPDQLTGQQIPLLARIISVADVYDALTQVRPYRRHQLTPLEAIEVIEAQSAGQLDTDLVCQFSKIIRSSAETVVEMESLKK